MLLKDMLIAFMVCMTLAFCAVQFRMASDSKLQCDNQRFDKIEKLLEELKKGF